MNCPNCKAYNPSNAKYCSQCGAAISATDDQEEDSDQAQSHLNQIFSTESSQTAGMLVPKRLGQLISESFAIYIGNFGVLWRIALVGHIPSIIAVFISNDALAASFALGGIFTGFLASAATVYAVTQYYLGRTVTVGKCYTAALNSGTSILMASLVFVVAVAVAALLSAILIGIPLLIFILFAFFFYIQAILVEGQGPMAALARSWELVRGTWWRVFGILLVPYTAIITPSVLGLIFGFTNTTPGDLLTTIVNLLIFPIVYVGGTLVYFDLRVRKEAYDLDRLTSEMG